MTTKRMTTRATTNAQQQDNQNMTAVMMNPVVLKCLFEVCGVEVLTFRLVCKQWYSVSLTEVRKRHPVRIQQSTKHGSDRSDVWLQWETLKNQLDICHVDVGSAIKPINNFHLMDVNFCSSPKEQVYKNMNLFWVNYGHNIRKLEIYSFSVYSVKAYKKAIFELTPNLEELGLNCRETKGDRVLDDEASDGNSEEQVEAKPNLNLKVFGVEIEHELKLPWDDYFTHFPNINDLWISDWGLQNRIDRSLLDAMNKLGKTNKDCAIHRLHLSEKVFKKTSSPRGSSKVVIVRQFLQLPFLKLTDLSLGLGGSEYFKGDGRNVLPTALHFHGATLKKLKFSGNKFEKFAPYYNFPFIKGTFSSLTELVLEGRLTWNLHFLEQMPNLERLEIRMSHPRIFDTTDLERLERVRLPHIRKFTFASIHVPESAMEVLVKVMPNVTDLSAPLLTPSFRLVCKHYGQTLRLLMVSSGFDDCGGEPLLPRCEGVIDDEGLTGILDGCEEIEKRLPNITDLKYLTFLEVKTTQKLGEISLTKGFLQLPFLTYLRTRFPEMSDETEEAFNNLERPVEFTPRGVIREPLIICDLANDDSEESDHEDDTEGESN